VFLLERTGQRIVARLRSRLFAHLGGLEMAFFDRIKTGELVNRLSVSASVINPPTVFD
jgi:ABC-type multidrug transport system fused ATPase/permease subunit